MTLASSPMKACTRRSASAASSGAPTVPVSSTVLVPHGGHADLGIGHRQRQHLVDAADVRADPDIGREDHVAAFVAGVDRGLAAGASEDIKLALRLDLDIGDSFVSRRTRRSSRRARSPVRRGPIDRTISWVGLTTCCAVAVAAGMAAIGAATMAASSSLAFRLSVMVRLPSGLPVASALECGRKELLIGIIAPLEDLRRGDGGRAWPVLLTPRAWLPTMPPAACGPTGVSSVALPRVTRTLGPL